MPNVSEPVNVTWKPQMMLSRPDPKSTNNDAPAVGRSRGSTRPAHQDPELDGRGRGGRRSPGSDRASSGASRPPPRSPDRRRSEAWSGVRCAVGSGRARTRGPGRPGSPTRRGRRTAFSPAWKTGTGSPATTTRRKSGERDSARPRNVPARAARRPRPPALVPRRRRRPRARRYPKARTAGPWVRGSVGRRQVATTSSPNMPVTRCGGPPSTFGCCAARRAARRVPGTSSGSAPVGIEQNTR